VTPIQAIRGKDAIGALIGAMRGGNVYVNVHTDRHPGGEIRSQIVQEMTGTK
jgi:hypothetical protein